MKVSRRALVVGIEKYRDESPLNAAASDASRIAPLLERNADGSANWEVTRLDDLVDSEHVAARQVDDAIQALFALDPDAVPTDLLLYFSGHARIRPDGLTVLQAHDGDAYSLAQLFSAVARSRARSITIILDCCMSGDIASAPGIDPMQPDRTLLLPENVNILTASRPREPAFEDLLNGLFSRRLIGGLRGAAGDLTGKVTPLSLYSYASEAFAEGEQRPTFKSHTLHPVTLRTSEARVPADHLTRIRDIFGARNARVTLSMRHEGDRDDDGWEDRELETFTPFTGSAHQVELDHLKEYRDTHLVKSVDGSDFYWLCRRGGQVQLTSLGQHYWELADARRQAERSAGVEGATA